MTGHVEDVTHKQPPRLKSNQMFSRNHLEAREPNGDVEPLTFQMFEIRHRWDEQGFLGCSKNKNKRFDSLLNLISLGTIGRRTLGGNARPCSSIDMDRKVNHSKQKTIWSKQNEIWPQTFISCPDKRSSLVPPKVHRPPEYSPLSPVFTPSYGKNILLPFCWNWLSVEGTDT